MATGDEQEDGEPDLETRVNSENPSSSPDSEPVSIHGVKIDYATLFTKTDWTAFAKIDYATILTKVDWAAIAKAVGSHRGALPANLKRTSLGRLLSLQEVTQEGIPLYLVPRAATVEALLSASSRQARRDILGRKFASILQDCSELLDVCTDPEFLYEVSALREAIHVLEAGQTRAGQALAANVMDSLMWRWRGVQTTDWRIVTRKSGNSHQALEEFGLRRFLVMAPVHAAHKSFWPSNGEPIPRTFNRHASLHRVSRQQYSKRNAVVAMMLASSLLGYFNEP